MELRRYLDQFLNIPSTDPDDARRKKLLNIMLLGLGALALSAIVATWIFGGILAETGRLTSLRWATMIAFLLTVAVYAINRYGPSWLASSLFLTMLTGILALADEPMEVVNGRSLLTMGVPIVMASVLLQPWASFVAAVAISGLIYIMATNIGSVPNPFAMVTFFVFALVSWLAARSLQRALTDLRTLNVELDRRVQNRTRDLAESLARNQAILDSTTDGVLVFDTQNRVAAANPAMNRLLHAPVRGIDGRTIETLMEGQVPEGDRDTFLSYVAEREPQSGFTIHWGKRVYFVSLAPVREDAGRVSGTVAVFRDYTREAEIDRMKSTFVSIASHELRTPLNAIMGYSEMLKEGVYGPLQPKQEGAVGRLTANCAHMLGLVNNLLDRARIEAGTLELNLAEFDPSDLAAGTSGMLEMIAQNKGLSFHTHIAENLPTRLVGDRQRLQQIVINLGHNAIKFTNEGSVTMTMRMDGPEHWAIDVEDTGVGIPPDALEYIFDPFRQADDSATREYGGAGLGLAIVKEIVSLMGGTVRVESEVGRGSKFTVVVPLQPPDPDSQANMATQGAPWERREAREGKT